MAATDGWIERKIGSAAISRVKSRSASRSLGAALRDAGLGDAAPDRHDDETVISSIRASTSQAASAIATSRSPSLAVFAEPEEAQPDIPTPATAKPTASTPSVVSPPPWLRAARRGRRHARMLNAFGWLMTLVIAGAIIGVAGRYLAVPPLSVQTTMQARQ